MINKFCPKCGKEIEKGIMCNSCTNSNVTLSYEVPLIQISEFNRVYYKSVWRRFDDLEEVIRFRVRKELNDQEIQIDIPSFEFIPQSKEKTSFQVLAHIHGKIIPLDVKLSYMQCDFGQKQKTAYYEGIMQIRKPNDQVIAFLDKEMKQLAPKGVFITKTVDQKNGFDLYFTNKNHMNILAQKIGIRYGAKVSNHAQLFSHDHLTSKDIYRLNVLVVMPEFIRGDVISFQYPKKGKITGIIKTMGKIILAYDLNLKKNSGFELKGCTEIVVYKKKQTTVTNIHPKIYALDPETFQEEILLNPLQKKVVAGEKITTVKTPQGLYLID